MSDAIKNYPETECKKPSDALERTKPGENISYNVENMTFIVTPVYRDDKGQTIHDILLNLMERECENP